MINRREFIKRLGALGAAAIVSPKVLIDEGVGYEVEPEKDPRIIGTLGGVPIIETDLSEEVACFMPLGGLEWTGNAHAETSERSRLQSHRFQAAIEPVEGDGEPLEIEFERPSLYSRLCELHNSQRITTEQIQKRYKRRGWLSVSDELFADTEFMERIYELLELTNITTHLHTSFTEDFTSVKGDSPLFDLIERGATNPQYEIIPRGKWNNKTQQYDLVLVDAERIEQEKTTLANRSLLAFDTWGFSSTDRLPAYMQLDNLGYSSTKLCEMLRRDAERRRA